MSLRSALRVSLLLGTLGSLACAVEETDFPADDGGGGDGGTLTVSGSSNGGSPIMTTAGKTSMPMGGSNAFGGTVSTAGSPSKGGSTSMGGKAGDGGKTGDGGGSKGGSGSAGSNTGGTMSGGSGGTGCTALRTWTPAMSMMIKPDEVIQWMGKRYKATQAIDWTNAECKPDAPAPWCSSWFTADGSC
jgi:hypothetical protein